MNKTITRSDINSFRGMTGMITEHLHPNRSARRMKVKRNRNKHLIGGGRIPPQYGFVLNNYPYPEI